MGPIVLERFFSWDVLSVHPILRGAVHPILRGTGRRFLTRNFSINVAQSTQQRTELVPVG